MPQEDPSRTEDPTQKRIKKAREDGNVPKSQEVGKSFVILAGLSAMYFYISFLAEYLMGTYRYFFTVCFEFNPTNQEVVALMVTTMIQIAKMIMPMLLFMGLVAYLANRLQVGSLWAPKVFDPKFGRIFDIVGGLKRMMFNLNTFVRLGKSILMAICIGIAPYIVIRQEMDHLLPLFYQDAFHLSSYLLSTGAKMVVYAIVPMFIIAAADLWYTRWDYNENLKMTKDEVKDERKQAEGDPKIKMKQKQKMLAVGMKRMMKKVPQADVVITNPTHFAVALQYDPVLAPAPVVLAKGADHMALKIKEVAREHNIPIRENKPLAQALYKQVEIGDSIPAELFQAVASILASLNKFKRPNGRPR